MNAEELDKKILLATQEVEEKKQAITGTSIHFPPPPNLTQTSWWSTNNAMTMSASVLIFGLVVCGLVTMLLRIGKSADEILKGFSTILIIVAGLFLVVAGYEDKQIAPMIGLLGTIAGYILGRNSRDDTKN